MCLSREQLHIFLKLSEENCLQKFKSYETKD